MKTYNDWELNFMEDIVQDIIKLVSNYTENNPFYILGIVTAKAQKLNDFMKNQGTIK